MAVRELIVEFQEKPLLAKIFLAGVCGNRSHDAGEVKSHRRRLVSGEPERKGARCL